MRIDLEVGGSRYEGWVSFSVSSSLTGVARTCDMAGSMRWSSLDVPPPILPPASARILVDDAPILNGMIERVRPGLGPDRHPLSLSGRSRTGLLVKCSAIVPGGQFVGVTLDQIARRFGAEHNIPVIVDCDCGAPFPEVVVNGGDSKFAVLDRMAAARRVLLTDTPDGALRLTRAIGTGEVEVLREGDGRLVEADPEYTSDARYGLYQVRSQQPAALDGDVAAETMVQGTATDPAMPASHVLLHQSADPLTPSGARELASWLARRRAGESLSVPVTLRGFYAPSGRIWQPGMLVHLYAPSIWVDARLVVSDVTLSLGNDGARASLTLVPAAALTPEPAAPQDRGQRGVHAWSELRDGV